VRVLWVSLSNEAEVVMSHKRCTQCSGEVTADSDFCPHCGTLFVRGEPAVCDTHSESEAEGVCIICRKVICGACGKQKDRRWFCTKHRGVKVEQDWVLIFESPEINESELVKSVLESVGLHVVVRNFNANTVVWEGGGDSMVSRQTLNRPAKVFVPIPEYEDALKAFEEWESASEDRS